MKHLKIRIPMYFIGLFIMTIGIALSVKSNLGVSPVSSIPYTMTCVWGIEMGKATILFHMVLVVIQILLLHSLGSVGAGTIIAAILVGTFVGMINRTFGSQRDALLGKNEKAAAEAARVAERDHISADAAAAKVKKVNHERAVHCKHFTKTDWGNVKNYDLCIKSDDFGVEDTAKIIRKLFQKKMGV